MYLLKYLWLDIVVKWNGFTKSEVSSFNFIHFRCITVWNTAIS